VGEGAVEGAAEAVAGGAVVAGTVDAGADEVAVAADVAGAGGMLEAVTGAALVTEFVVEVAPVEEPPPQAASPRTALSPSRGSVRAVRDMEGSSR
jgi:hypothetical protein